MKKKNILLIDDSELTRSEFAQIFGATQYSLVFAVNSQEGLKKIKEVFFDLVLLDIIMPDLNGEKSKTAGLELLSEIKKERPSLPIIMLSTIDLVDVAVKALKIGANDYIVKEKSSSKEIIKKCENLLYYEILETEIRKVLKLNRKINMYTLYKKIEDIEGIEKSKFIIVLDDMKASKQIEIDQSHNIIVKELKGGK